MKWLESQESELDRLFRGNDDAAGAVPPADPDRVVAWEMNGFFMACWLAYQPDVHSVEYKPSGVKYEIQPGTVESEFQRYLDHKSEELRRTSPADNSQVHR